MNNTELRKLEDQLPGSVISSLVHRKCNNNWSEEKYVDKLNGCIFARKSATLFRSYDGKIHPDDLNDIQYEAMTENWSLEKIKVELYEAWQKQKKQEKIAYRKMIENDADFYTFC